MMYNIHFYNTGLIIKKKNNIIREKEKENKKLVI